MQQTSIKAIVLSCDRYRPLTEHMMQCYEKAWPNHPFRFRIPYQELGGVDDERREFIRTPISFQDTVRGLLADLPDEEWVYWCIDDKYPIRLDIQKIEQVMNWTLNEAPDEVSGVMFCRARQAKSGASLNGERVKAPNGDVYLRRKNYREIWLHQFTRVKVLRTVFEELKGVTEAAHSMDRAVKALELPDDHVLLVTKRNLVEFGESTTRGKMTRNCYESMSASGMQPPESFVVNHNKSIYIGRMNWYRRLRLKYGS